jgi:hypothetical protein
VEWKPILSWLQDGCVRWALGIGAGAGFLLGLLIFGEPWHLPPDWGDTPTWLLVVVGVVGGWAALRQLRILQQQVKDEAERNVKRDELLQSQLDEAKTRARSDRRKQAEDVNVRHSDGNGQVFGYVENKSLRPITDITCNIMSKTDGNLIAAPSKRGEFFTSTGTLGGSVQMRPIEVAPEEQSGSRYGTLRPGKQCRFTFDGLSADPAHIVVAWFTDDAGFRWQLDEFLHLAETTGDEYKP